MESSKNLLDILASLSDVTLIAGLDREKVPVVRKLLTQNSVYFEKLLGPSFREGSQQEVILQDIDGLTLTAIITFIYSSNVDLTEECVANILDGASRMELVSLEKSCEEFLRKNLSKENCLPTLVLADKHCFDALKTTALEFVGAHFERISESDLLQLDGRVLGEILNYGKLCLAETSVFDLLVRWAEKNEQICSQFMPNLLKSIRLEYLPGEFISNVAEPIFERYESSELIGAEYKRRVLSHQISARHRYYDKSIGTNVFYAEIMDNERIDIYQCYPKNKHFASIPFSTSRTQQGWVFHGGKFYQMGGYYAAEGGRTSAEVECIDMDTKRSTKLPNMIIARSEFEPVAAGKHIYVFGGKNKHGLIYGCERFDTESNMWEALPTMPRALRKCAGIEMDEKVFVFGLFDGSTQMFTCEYDPGTKKWSNANVLGSNYPNMKIVVVKHADHTFNVITSLSKIRSFDTRNGSSRETEILLPGIEKLKIMECGGSPYIFYKSSDQYKFGRIDFDGNECSVVDFVETSEKSLKGFLFMQ